MLGFVVDWELGFLWEAREEATQGRGTQGRGAMRAVKQMDKKQFEKSNFVYLWLKMTKSRRREKLEIIKDRRRKDELDARRLWGRTLLCELPTVDDLPEMLSDIWSDDSKLQLFATRRYGLLLSSNCCPSIDGIIRGRVIPRLVHFLSWGKKNQPQLQIESAIILANIGRKCPKKVLDSGGYELFVKLLGSPYYELRVQALWGLGNLAELYLEWRDSMLSSGALDQVLNLLNSAVAEPVSNLSLLKAGSRTLAKFCRDRVLLDYDKVIQTAMVLFGVDDEEVIRHACWILVDMCHRINDSNDFRKCSRILHRILHLLDYQSISVMIPVLRLAFIIVTAHDYHRHEVRQGFVERLLCSMRNILPLNFPNLEREVSRILTNIADMRFPYIQLVIDSGILDQLVELVSDDIEKGVDDEVVMTLCTVASRSNFMQVRQLAEGECLNLLAQLVICEHKNIADLAGNAVKLIMRVVNEAGRSCTHYVVSGKAKLIISL